MRLAEPSLARATSAFWAHPRLADLFPRYLLALHGSMRATLPLLRTAARRARRLADPVSRRLAPYFERHAREERGHDRWLLSDLASLGVPARRVRAAPPSSSLARLVGAQYYWLLHAHPVALLGFFCVLEGLPPTVGQISRVRRASGLAPEAFRTLLAHAREDPGHGREAFALLDELPLDRTQSELVALSALSTMEALGDVYGELVEA